MKKKLQVFVSSTYMDMLAERQAVVEAILRAGHIPAGMELFAAGDESQSETIRRWIDDSDVFVLILGGRYGSIEPESGKSYIELEYQYAIEQRKPFFAAVISEEHLTSKVKALGPDALERNNGQLLKAFRDTVTKKICRFYGDINELKLIVFESLANFARNDNLSGWIKGSDAIDPKSTLEEIQRLQGENSELRRNLKELRIMVKSSRQVDRLESVISTLSEDAKVFLVRAKNTGFVKEFHDEDKKDRGLRFGTRDYLEAKVHREIVSWRAALKQLEDHDLVQFDIISGQGELTKTGYKVADEIELKRQAQ